MNTKELIAEIATATGLSRKSVGELLGHTTEILTEELLKGKSIHLKGFGDFEIKEKKERVTVLPGSNERTLTPARKQISFKQTASLKENLNKA